MCVWCVVFLRSALWADEWLSAYSTHKNEASVVVCCVICVCSKINRVIKLLLQSSMSQKYRYHYYHSHRYYY